MGEKGEEVGEEVGERGESGEGENTGIIDLFNSRSK